MVRYKSGKYFIVFEQKYLEKIESSKFVILDEVRAVETEGDFPPSLSIGVGVGGKTLVELDEYALAALDLALGRGGDQAVVKRKSRVEYYGGRLQTVEKRNKGKSRIMAHALRQMIDQAGKVVIMGHKNPDMDSFGAALGISRIVINRNKEGAIVLRGNSNSISKVYKSALESGQHRFITPEEAKAVVDKDTLVIIVDAHRPSLLEAPELLSMTDKIVVIDHHRKAEDSIDNATLTYMEAYASSTSELVAEILQYIGDGKRTIEKLEAEALLAGIAVDTKNFSVKTGARTFEAASWLRRNGADTANVRQFFQTDMDSFKLKATIIANAEIIADGVALSVCEGWHPNVQVLISQAADELLNIQGIRASFVVGTNESGVTVVSARSLGEINVQTIMEKLGGGGHYSTAGAQTNMSLEETVEDLKDLIRTMDRNGGL
jgi:c-di-AMP phosphodiesterase-like protein